MDTRTNIVLADFKAQDTWSFMSILKNVTGKNWGIIYRCTNNLHKNSFTNLH